jgi:hypothetical protein
MTADPKPVGWVAAVRWMEELLVQRAEQFGNADDIATEMASGLIERGFLSPPDQARKIATQIREAKEHARREALEEAAVICDRRAWANHENGSPNGRYQNAAHAIRALARTPSAHGGDDARS